MKRPASTPVKASIGSSSDGPSFFDTRTMNRLGPAPFSNPIPARAWDYGAASEAINFANFEQMALVWLVLRVTGARVGVSICSPDGTTLLTPEQVALPSATARTVLIRVPPHIGFGSILLRNYDDEGAEGLVDVLRAEVLPAGSPRMSLVATLYPLFDADWYVKENEGLQLQDEDAFSHYIRAGLYNDADPNPFFNSIWYRSVYGDVAQSPFPPIEHYLFVGHKKGHDPSPLFVTDWYREQTGLAAGDESPLQHFWLKGRLEGARPNPYKEQFLFDLADSGDVVNARRWYAHLQPLPTNAPIPTAAVFPLDGLYEFAERKRQLLFDEKPLLPLKKAKERPDALPGRFVAKLNNVVVQGGSSVVISSDGRLLHDEILFSSQHFPTEPKAPNVTLLNDGQVIMRTTDPFVPHIGRGVHLMNEADANYFHWVIEVLPRLVLLDKANLLEKLAADSTFFITDGLAPTLLEMIKFVTPADLKLSKLKRGGMYRAEEIIFPANPARILNNYLRPPSRVSSCLPTDLLAELSRKVRKNAGIENVKSGRRVYLHRSSGYRLLTNQDEVQDRLIEAGFEIVDPANLSARSQIQLFAQCDEIVAPTGAAITNILWCRPGCKVTILYPEHPMMNPGIWDDLGSASRVQLRHIYGERDFKVVGKYSIHDDFKVSKAQIAEII